jgi:hypothetical protein
LSKETALSPDSLEYALKYHWPKGWATKLNNIAAVDNVARERGIGRLYLMICVASREEKTEVIEVMTYFR